MTIFWHPGKMKYFFAHNPQNMTKRKRLDPEVSARAMRVLKVVMEHTGTKNVQLLQKWCDATEIQQLKAYTENAKAWSQVTEEGLFQLAKLTYTLNFHKDETMQSCSDFFMDNFAKNLIGEKQCDHTDAKGCESCKNIQFHWNNFRLLQKCLSTRGYWSYVTQEAMDYYLKDPRPRSKLLPCDIFIVGQGDHAPFSDGNLEEATECPK